MKQSIYLLVMTAAIVAASVNMTSCSKSDDDIIPGYYVGTWTCELYCPANETNMPIVMYAEDGYPPTTVTINGDGTCSGSGMVINGSGTCSVKTGNGWNDGYWAIITFYQNGKTVNTATVKSYKNDHMTGYVLLQGYSDKWFIFKK
jgi:hypothetical protein